MTKPPIRIGSFSGYFGDRFTAIDEAVVGDPVDVLIGDYLAEITLAALAKGYLKNPDKGYVEYFVTQLAPNLASLTASKCKIVTNAGGFNPRGLAEKLRQLIAEAGLALRVAYVEGDNILAQLDELQAAGHDFTHLDSGLPLRDWKAAPITANAYLGGWGIAEALAYGADIVVCGRVTDASLVLGPAAWWHGWSPTDWNLLSSAVIAGHIIECGAHATGGNFSGFTKIADLSRPGFPIAEIAADGEVVITKHGRDGGAVTVDTVTAQLLYEIQGPFYLNPDVTAHIDSVNISQLAPDRVRLSGITGSPPPPTTKVAIFSQIGFQIVKIIFGTGLNIDAKVELFRRQLSALIDQSQIDQLTVTRLGIPDPEARTQWDSTVAIRIMATATNEAALQPENFGLKADSLYLCTFPGFYTDTASLPVLKPRPRIEYWPALLDMAALHHRVVMHDGSSLEVAPPSQTELRRQPLHPEPVPAAFTASRQMPLGAMAYARSGDKGGNANVGIWVPGEAEWPWLRSLLSTECFRALIPEAGNLTIIRHEFPQLRAVHFIVQGLLGSGGSSNMRPDQVAKAVGEYVLSRRVAVPEGIACHGAILNG